MIGRRRVLQANRDGSDYALRQEPVAQRPATSVISLCAAACVFLAVALAMVCVGAAGGPKPRQRSVHDARGGHPPGLSTVDVRHFERFAGPHYGSIGHAATASDTQTKLWFAKGSWWGVLEDRGASGTYIFRWTGRRWSATGVRVDPRPLARCDVAYTNGLLYIASRRSRGPLSLRVFRMSRGGQWAPRGRAATTISPRGATSLSIAVDSSDRVWAVFNAANRVWLTHSSAHGRGFTAPEAVTGPGAVEADDTSAVVAVNRQIAVLWSDQVKGAFRFAIRADTEPVNQLRVTKPPVEGIRISDGHIHLLATSDGRILAAVKTSLGDASVDPPRSPLLVLLERSPRGSWTQHVAATTADQMTRPEIALSRDERVLFLVATSPQTGGSVYVKVADAHRLEFSPGKGTRLLGGASQNVNNATLARARVSRRTGLLVLASDSDHAKYHTAFIPFGQTTAGSQPRVR